MKGQRCPPHLSLPTWGSAPYQLYHQEPRHPRASCETRVLLTPQAGPHPTPAGSPLPGEMYPECIEGARPVKGTEGPLERKAVLVGSL